MTQPAKALFLPFLKIPTGHHHVADSLIHAVQDCEKGMICDKVDLLSYSYGKMEKVVSYTYLNWIKLLPGTYNRLYRINAYRKNIRSKRHYFYELLFSSFLKRLIHRKSPQIVFCTHALPSNIVSVLKMKHQLKIIAINVYTDFFVNRIWGIDGIDYHFVPTLEVKNFLLEKGVNEEQIFITGIPVHAAFLKQEMRDNIVNDVISVLVTGGSLGIGAIDQLIAASIDEDHVHYHVLCGKNKKLYNQLIGKHYNVTPYAYIESKVKMNDLYEQVDAIVTKPGGVTISEGLMKGKPVFVYNPLPGQEQINADHLQRQGLVMSIDSNDCLGEQLVRYFNDKRKQQNYGKCLRTYQQNLEQDPINVIVDRMMKQKHQHG